MHINPKLVYCNPHLLVGVDELCAAVSGQHVDDGHLTPLIHIHQQVAQLAVVLVDQVDPLRTHLLKGLDG